MRRQSARGRNINGWASARRFLLRHSVGIRWASREGREREQGQGKREAMDARPSLERASFVSAGLAEPAQSQSAGFLPTPTVVPPLSIRPSTNTHTTHTPPHTAGTLTYQRPHPDSTMNSSGTATFTTSARAIRVPAPRCPFDAMVVASGAGRTLAAVLSGHCVKATNCCMADRCADV